MKKKSKSSFIKKERKVLGVVASMKNVMIAIALLFGFMGGFFQTYNWLVTTFAKDLRVTKIENEFHLERENNVLNAMYSRYYILDNMVSLAVDPTKVPDAIRTEYNDLKYKIKMQEEKVKLLQQKVVQ
jgi:hypothetical protein